MSSRITRGGVVVPPIASEGEGIRFDPRARTSVILEIHERIICLLLYLKFTTSFTVKGKICLKNAHTCEAIQWGV